jgi:response regulator of citrate/malate metabolism
MNCIIVDDDQMSCKILEGYVAKCSSLNLAGTFSDSVEARNIITKRRISTSLFSIFTCRS